VPTAVPGRRPILRWSALTQVRAATATIRLLVVTQMAFNIGFFMVLPYLSVHLTQDVGLGAAVVGLVLGIRTFSQQGLFFVGGTLSDRFGVRRVVLTGCVLRILGFAGLAVLDSVGGIIAATVLTGFAAALFSPAVESALATEADINEQAGGARSVDTFALFNVFGQIGTCTGPLVGSALLFVDFRLVCFVAAGVFCAILGAHIVWLPRRPGEDRDEPWLSGWKEVIGNTRFVLFAIAMSAQLAAYNQLYLLLPLEVERAWGSQTPLGWFFALSAVLVIGSQMPITRALSGKPVGLILAAGFAVMASGFVVVAAFTPAAPTGLAGLIPAAIFVILLAMGQMVAMPYARTLVPVLASGRRLGAYYGFMASVGGVAVLIGSVAIGAIIDAVHATGAGAALPWLCAAASPLLGATALVWLANDTPISPGSGGRAL
jgi:hypothetical protein